MAVEREKSIKLGWVVSPSDYIQLVDTSGWYYRFQIFLYHINNPIVDSKAFSSNLYFFSLLQQHSGKLNMAFLDGHAKQGSLRDWILPVETVHPRWHYDGKGHLNRLVYWNVENWESLRGVG